MSTRNHIAVHKDCHAQKDHRRTKHDKTTYEPSHEKT